MDLKFIASLCSQNQSISPKSKKKKSKTIESLTQLDENSRIIHCERIGFKEPPRKKLFRGYDKTDGITNQIEIQAGNKFNDINFTDMVDISSTYNENVSKIEMEILCKGKPKLSDDPELKNKMFGDIVGIIELYNRIIPLHTTGEFSLKKYRNCSPNTLNENETIDETLLEYESFLNIIKAESGNVQKIAFCDIVKNLLKIVLQYDTTYDVLSIFGKRLKELTIHDSYLKELCKIIEAYNVTNMLSLENNEINLIFPSQEMLKSSELLTLICISHSELPDFSNFTASQKIIVIRSLCDLVLCNGKYREFLDKKRAEIDKIKIEFKKISNEIKSLFETSNKRLLKEKFKDKSKNSIEKLAKKEEQVRRKQKEYYDFERLNPLGVDSMDHIYWDFSCFKKLIVEKRIGEKEDSQWFSIEDTDVEGIIKVLEDSNQDKNLIGSLREFLTNSKKESVETVKNSGILHSNIRDQNKKKTASEKYELLPKRACLVRSCNANRFVKNIKIEDTDDSPANILEKPKVEVEFDYKNDWLETFNRLILSNNTLQAENLLLYFVNFESYKYFHGIINEDKYKNFKRIAKEYQRLSSSVEKFEKLKEAVEITIHSIFPTCNYFTHLNKDNKDNLFRIIRETSSLSTLCLIASIQIQMTNWKSLCIGICETCRKLGPYFKNLESLNKLDEYWKNEKESKLGYLTCKLCKFDSETRYLHRSCFFKKDSRSEKQISSTGAYRYCHVCVRKKGPL